MIISCQILLGLLDGCMVTNHLLRLLFMIFPVRKLPSLTLTKTDAISESMIQVLYCRAVSLGRA